MVHQRTQAERREDSRQRLIQAAIVLLAERGYAHTSLVEIGRAAGLSRGLVSHHFGSKEACMRAVVESIRKSVREKHAKVLDSGSNAIDSLLDVYFAGARSGEPNGRAMHAILIEGLTSTPGLQPAVAETNAISRGFIADLIAQAMDAPPVDPAEDEAIQSVAVVVEGILRGVALQWHADPEHVDLDTAAAWAKVMIRGALAALEPVG
ncbi:TetR/AcrR family transcriptional regulator [Streptomyces sp. CA-100214]